MTKSLYITLIFLVGILAIDVYTYKETDIKDSIVKLEAYVNSHIENARRNISNESNYNLFRKTNLNVDELNQIKSIEESLKSQHISIKILDQGEPLVWLNNRDHNTICRSFVYNNSELEICLNPFNNDLRVHESIGIEAHLENTFELSNSGDGAVQFFNKWVKPIDYYRTVNLNNVFIVLYFFLFIYLLYVFIKNRLYLGVAFLALGRVLLFIFPSWHERFANSSFMQQILEWKTYGTVDLILDSIILFLILSTYSTSQFKREVPKSKQLFVFFHSVFIALLIVSHIRLIQVLSFSDLVDLSINDLSRIDFTGISIFIAILLIQAGIFVYTINFVKKLKSEVGRKPLYFSLVLCTLFSSGFSILFQLDLDIFLTSLFFLSYFILIDLFIDVKAKSITWIIWWAIFFGVYLSSLFFNYDIKKDLRESGRILADTFEDVQPSTLDSLITSDILNQINTSFSELLILPKEANYDHLDIISYLQEKHGESEILIDISNAETYSYFRFLPEGLLLNQVKPNYFFDEIDNTLWFSQTFNDTITLHTGIIVKPPAIKSKPFGYYKNGDSYVSNLTISESEIEDIANSPNQYLNKNSNVYVKHVLGDNEFAFSKKSIKSIIKPVALFSFLFSIIIVLVLTLGFISQYISFLSSLWPYNLKSVESLNSKIQIALILVILLSFILIAFITSSFLKSFIDNKNDEYLTDKLEAVSRDINLKVRVANSTSEAFTIGTNYQEQIEQIHNVELSFNTLKDISLQMEYFPFAYFSKFKNATAYSTKDQEGKIISYLPFKFKQDILGFVKVRNQSSKFEGLNVFDFLGSIFNVYVFLFLIASVLAVFIARSITRPLSILNQKLTQLKFGKQNELITWEREDEIGTLINNYNTMVNQLEDSAALLAKTERDSAWREMAKQVAHEIKNPLTPMKMYIQHLEKAIKQKPEEAHLIAKKISATLLEQVENLTQIANSFGNFAELPQSSNEKIELNSVVELVHNLFRKRDDMEIILSEPIDTIYVYADKNQLIRILNNLVKNATEAIPKDRKGKIHLHLYKNDDKAFIKVTDNGSGIPDHMIEKVFQPKFTTKDSGSGLGLAIALNMIESMNGRMYFESVENEGTSFFIELDIIRDQITDKEKRIMLD
ncbi:MAG: GHKL domain-containing protein [Saprospiraceae bacterium]|nr:GHKL domain-containing protein [Bacteroidia bacterium]NNL92017.1 GHKL domain-containing protein [Saprospiraceae bacterium]